MQPGALRTRFSFERNVAGTDWTGHASPPDWREQFSLWGSVRYLRGTETVLAARLTARQPAILTVRNTARARSILASDRAVNAHTGEIYNIRELPRESRESTGYLEMLIESGAT